MTRTLENLYLETIPKTFKGYVNKDFYLHGYAPYFDFETMKDILTSLKAIDDARDYETKWSYSKKNDTFIYEDKENGYGKERYPGEDIETEDGIKHLYPTGEWMWDIAEDENEELNDAKLEMKDALEKLRSAWIDCECIFNDYRINCNDYILGSEETEDEYPFHLSFDEMPVVEWIDGVISRLGFYEEDDE